MLKLFIEELLLEERDLLCQFMLNMLKLWSVSTLSITMFDDSKFYHLSCINLLTCNNLIKKLTIWYNHRSMVECISFCVNIG